MLAKRGLLTRPLQSCRGTGGFLGFLVLCGIAVPVEAKASVLSVLLRMIRHRFASGFTTAAGSCKVQADTNATDPPAWHCPTQSSPAWWACPGLVGNLQSHFSHALHRYRGHWVKTCNSLPLESKTCFCDVFGLQVSKTTVCSVAFVSAWWDVCQP